MSIKPDLPKRIRTLKQIEADYDGALKACSLRAEFLAGNLRGFRARDSCNSKILVSDEDLAEWFDTYARKRQAALSPKEVKAANEASAPDTIVGETVAPPSMFAGRTRHPKTRRTRKK
jgi:hypothetical protein